MADKKVRIIITGRDDTKKALRSVSSGFKNIGKSLLGLGAKLTAGVTLPIVGLATAAAKAAIDYESAFAGVIKTTDGLIDSTGELTEAGKELNAGFRDLAGEIPLAAGELAGIGEIAGQLGVPKEDILEFTRTIADIGVTTNLTLEGAASDFARFANIVGMPMDDIDRLGSTIVELGNNLATTEGELVDMAMRIAGVGAVVGLTEPQILGWGAAMSSVGIRAEAGGTAISRVFADIAAAVAGGSEELEGFAETAGLSIDDFSELFEVDASAAMQAFVEGLGDIQDEGGNVLGILEDLSLDSVRVRDTLLRLAGAGPLVSEALGIAGQGWKENIALTKEAEQRYATTESRLGILKNTLVDLGITFGEIILPILQDVVAWIRPIITRFSEMDEGGQKLILMGGLLFAAIGPIVTIAGILATAIGALISPIGLVVAGIGLLVAKFVESQGGIAQTIETVKGLGATITALVTEHFAYVVAWVTENMPLIQQTIDTVMTAVRELWEFVWPYIQEILATAWENIVTLVDAAINSVLGIIRAIMLMITGDWRGAWEEIKAVLGNIMLGIWTVIQRTLNMVLGFFGETLESMVTAIIDKIGAFIQGGKSIVQGIIDGIKAAPGAIKDALMGLVSNAWNSVLEFFGIGSPSQVGIDFGQNLANSMAMGLQSGQAGLTNTMAGVSAGIATGMQAGGAAATSTAASKDFTFRIGNIMITIPGMGTFESGEISERVSTNEGELIDLRISMAAGSV